MANTRKKYLEKKGLVQVILYLTPEEKASLNAHGNMQDQARKMIKEHPIIKNELITLIGLKNVEVLLK